jgi:hypothetical protein
MMKTMVWFALACGCLSGGIGALLGGLYSQLPYWGVGLAIFSTIFLIKYRKM